MKNIKKKKKKNYYIKKRNKQDDVCIEPITAHSAQEIKNQSKTIKLCKFIKMNKAHMRVFKREKKRVIFSSSQEYYWLK